MKVVIPVSNQYLHLIPAQVHFLEKYWPGQEVEFLVHTHSDLPTPRNYKLNYVDTQTRAWTNTLIKYFKQSKDEVVALIMDDLILFDKVQQEDINLLASELEANRAQKAVIHRVLNNRAEPNEDGFLEVRQNATYRATLHPALWRVDYLLEKLKPDWTAWDFELKNPAGDGAKIISLDRDYHIYNAINVYKKGKMAMEIDTPYDQEDMGYLRCSITDNLRLTEL